jgi:hypothetical protein
MHGRRRIAFFIEIQLKLNSFAAIADLWRGKKSRQLNACARGFTIPPGVECVDSREFHRRMKIHVGTTNESAGRTILL